MSYINIIADAGADNVAKDMSGTASTTQQPESKPQGGDENNQGGWGFWPMLIIFFVLMYFLLIRPQKKQQKELKERQDGLKPGDKVISAGGIYGIVREVKENTIRMEIAPNTIIKIAKSSIVQTVAKDGAAETKK